MCKECNGSSVADCIDCYFGFALREGTCKEECQIGTYYDISTEICLPCWYYCFDCSSKLSCLICKNNLILTTDVCSCGES